MSTEPQTIEELPSKRELYAHLQDLQQTVETQSELIDQQQERIDDLERKTEFLQTTVDFHEEFFHNEMGFDAADNIAGDHGGLIPWLQSLEAKAPGQSSEERYQELRQDLLNEQQKRGTEDAKINRKVHVLAEETGVDIETSDIAGEDKIMRLLKHGPEDVTDRPSTVHERARTVLENATTIGTQTSDEFGTRVTFKGPTVREELEMVRNESLQSKQIRDVFEKLEALGEDSPRKVSFGKGPDGTYKLELQLLDEEVQR